MLNRSVKTGLSSPVIVVAVLCGACGGLADVVRADSRIDARHELHGHKTGVTAAAFSPDGRQLVTVGGVASRDRGEMIFWDVATGRKTRTITGHDGIIHTVAWLPDGRTLATAGRDQTVKLWDVARGKEQATLHGHRHWVLDVACSTDARHLASAGRDGEVRLWDLATSTGTVVADHAHWVMAVEFSPDGRRLASVSADTSRRLRPGQLVINDLNQPNGEPRIVPLEAGGYAVAMPPEEHQTIVGLGNQTILWLDITNGKETRRWKSHCDCLALSPDGRRLLSGGFDRLARLWDVKSGRVLSTLEGHGHTIYDVAFAPNSRQMATASRDRTARLWDAVDGEAAGRDVKEAGRPRGGRAMPADADLQRAKRIWLLLGLFALSALLNLVAAYLDRSRDADDADSVKIDLPDGPVNVPRKSIGYRSTSYCDARLVQHRPDLIVVSHPNLRSIGCGGVCLLLMSAYALLVFQLFPQERDLFDRLLYVLGALAGGVVAVVCGFIGAAVLLDDRRFRFDRSAHEIRMGMPGLRKVRSIDDVAALQLVRHDSYPELNLLFHGRPPERRNVSCHGDVLWTWHAARVLGQFLNVPLIDQYSDRDQPRVIEPREFDGLPSHQRTAAWLGSHVPTDHVNATSSSTRNRVLRRKDADRLVVRRGSGELLLGFLAVLLGIAVSLGVTYFFMGDWIHADPRTFWLGNASVIGWSVLVVGYLWRVTRWRVIFDRLKGRIVYGPGWERQQRRLEEVVAVQIIAGPMLGSSQRSPIYPTDQLNLVFDDPPLPRLNISCHADQEWTRTTARTIADFLNVPLLGQADAGDEASVREDALGSHCGDSASLAPPPGMVPYGVDARPMPSGKELDRLLPPKVGPFRRSAIDTPDDVHNTPIYARYRDGEIEIFVELGIGDSVVRAQRAIDTAQAETIAEFPDAPRLASTNTEPSFLKTTTNLGAFMAWTRGGYYFSAHAKDGEEALDRFMRAFPY